MGFWKTEHGIGGDSWADEMGSCMKKLSQDRVSNTKTYGKVEHEITMAEFADLVEFCSRGHISITIPYKGDADRPLSKLHDKGIETHTNSGQIHCHPGACGNTG